MRLALISLSAAFLLTSTATPDAFAGPGQPVPAPPGAGVSTAPRGTAPRAMPARPGTTVNRQPVRRPMPQAPAVAPQTPVVDQEQLSAEMVDVDDDVLPITDNNLFRGSYHPRQEGKDKPYSAEISLNIGLLPMKSTTPKLNGQKGETISTQGYSADLLYLMIFGPVGVGPTLGYSHESSTQSVTTAPTNASDPIETKDVTNTTTLTRYGVIGNLYMARLDKDVVVPYASVGFTWSASKNIEDTTTTESSGTMVSIGAGLLYFLDSNVALSPGLEYQVTTTKYPADKTEEDSTSLGVAMGISTFI